MDKYATNEEIQIADQLIEDLPKYPRKDNTLRLFTQRYHINTNNHQC